MGHSHSSCLKWALNGPVSFPSASLSIYTSVSGAWRDRCAQAGGERLQRPGATLQKSLLHFFPSLPTCMYLLSNETKASAENCLHFPDQKRCKVSVGLYSIMGMGFAAMTPTRRPGRRTYSVQMRSCLEVQRGDQCVSEKNKTPSKSLETKSGITRLVFSENSQDRLFTVSPLLTGVTSIPLSWGLCSTRG